MSTREQILGDQEFWTRLEYDATAWLENSEDKAKRRFWIDGFLPDSIKNTRFGADLEGTAWVGEGGRNQYPYHFTISVPQKILCRATHAFSIADLRLDHAQQELSILLGPKRIAQSRMQS